MIALRKLGKKDECGELSGLMSKRIKCLQTADAKYDELDKILKKVVNQKNVEKREIKSFFFCLDGEHLTESEKVIKNYNQDFKLSVIKEKTPDKRTTHWVPKVQTNEFFK